MIWLLLPLTAGGVIWWWWPKGESAPMLQQVPYSPSCEMPTHLPSLPSRPLQPEDWPQVEKTLRQAMAGCASSQWSSDTVRLFNPNQPATVPLIGLIGQIECLLTWLKGQACVKTVRTATAEAEGKTALRLLTSLPAQVEVEVDFLVGGEPVEPRILRWMVDTREQLQFVSLNPGAIAGP